MGPRAGLDRYGKSRPPTGIRSPDRPAGSQSLYRLSYRAHKNITCLSVNLLGVGEVLFFSAVKLFIDGL